MDPILIELGPLAIRWYGLLIALGVLAGAVWALREAPRRELNGDALLDMAPWLVIFGVIGARIGFVLTSPEPFFGAGGRPLDALAVWQGGLSIHGAIVGVTATVFVLARRKGMHPWAVMDVLTPIGAFGVIGGRIGNLMNGTDTGGRLTDLAIGMTWPERGTETFGAFGRAIFGSDLWAYAPPACAQVPIGQPCEIHATWAYGALVGVALIPVLLWAFRRTRAPGFVFAWFVLAYSALRSVLEEPFRDNPLVLPVYENVAAGIGFFTLTQLVSVALIAVAAFALTRIDPDAAPRRERLARKARGR